MSEKKVKVIAEYLWLDGYKPTPNIRSKAKVLEVEAPAMPNLPVAVPLAKIPDWGFDGSSTRQAEGKSSDCQLKPVAVFKDPIRGEPHVLVLCEVLNADGSTHESNTRALLRESTKKHANEQAWFGIEQEYTLFRGEQPLGWPHKGEPSETQGRYYCGANIGDDIVDMHLEACLAAGLEICGVNSEVMLGQWEFQVGPLGPLEASDQLIAARWLLQRLGKRLGVRPSFDPKPREGDWNGAGAHTNFSTKTMRDAGGIKAIETACEKLGAARGEHVKVYGAGNRRRLTGKHETCSIDEFRFGPSDRGASIRIPLATLEKGCGYLEDRRPAANMDPYLVCAALLETACGAGYRAPPSHSGQVERYLTSGFEEVWNDGEKPAVKKDFYPVNGP